MQLSGLLRSGVRVLTVELTNNEGMLHPLTDIIIIAKSVNLKPVRIYHQKHVLHMLHRYNPLLLV